MPPATLFRYMAMRSVFAIGALYLILSCLVLLIDLIENMRFAGKFADGSLSFAFSLTLMRIPSLIQTLTPFVFLFASIWTFYQLNKRSEISVMRSAGVSIWKLLGPAAFLASVFGILMITVVDPLSSKLYTYSEQVMAVKEGKSSSLVKLFGDGIWLRQTDGDDKLIINARSFNKEKVALSKVIIWRFDDENHFLERIDAPEGLIRDKTLELHDTSLRSVDEIENRKAPIYAIATNLSGADLGERIAPPETMSLWQLPKYIPLVEAAGLPTVRYHIRFHDLCSTPLKLLAMVLIAAAFSMRPTRMGGALPLVIMSLGAGFLLYLLSEISSALGESGIAPIILSAWTPAIIATLISVTALLHLEDG